MQTGTMEARRAIVVGGASGFGLAVARAGLAEGWDVVVADIAEDRLHAVAADNPGLRATPMDVTDATRVREAVRNADAQLGGIDTIIYCAGVIHEKPLEAVTEKDWDTTFDVNVKGAFLVVQAAVEALKQSGRGRVILISSMSGKVGYAGYHAYCASKFGVVGLAESLAAELASSKVTVNCICPASCPTTGMGRMIAQVPAGKEHDEQYLRDAAASFPIGRYVEESDVAGAAMYLASDAAGIITGSSIELDGGRRFRPG